FETKFPHPKKPKFTFIDLFAGIGGFRIAFQNLDGRCVFSSEIDKSAKKTYTLNFGDCPFGDIRNFTGEEVSDEELDLMIPDHDILTGGFPCQPFSLAGVSARNHLGKAHGFLDKIQGTLFYDIVRIIDVKRPEAVFLENVKNFKSHNKGDTLKTVLSVMEALDYDSHTMEINANMKVPQNRKRFYMVFFKKKNTFFEFPKYSGETLKLKSILEENVAEYYTISDKLWEGHKRRTKLNLERGTGFTAFEADIEKPSNTIVARYGKDGKECLIPQVGKNPRKLTKLECARLQGYPEDFVLPLSDAAAYRQFGNSVAVPVIQDIGKSILDSLIKNNVKLNGI
ncbi:MAG: DNA cytosine methyltransferase, partial [Mariniphaga sp.]